MGNMAVGQEGFGAVEAGSCLGLGGSNRPGSLRKGLAGGPHFLKSS